MGRPRHTSLAEQNVWMEQRIAELEAEDEWKQKQIVSQRKRIAELEQVLIELESRTSGQCTLESLNRICRVALGKEIEK